MEELVLTPETRIFAHAAENGRDYVIPPLNQPRRFSGCGFLWAIDEPGGKSRCFRTDGGYRVRRGKDAIRVFFDAPYSVTEGEAYPRCDFFGNRFCIRIGGDSRLETAMAHFYWKNLLNQCAERTLMRRKKRLREGYVLSTLRTDFYAGTYPAVDHEFHIRGRMAMGGPFDLQVVRRMMELQLRLMRTDWRRLYRAPCSLQPNGRREYRVTRKSLDRRVRAVMFPLTGIVELIEEMYRYYCRTKDLDFIRTHLNTLEGGVEFVKRHLDADGCMWGDVYYEDQVMKDGATAQAQAFAIHSMYLMARLETLAGRPDRACEYNELAQRMQAHYIRPVPDGYWDPKAGRYIDWIDRDGAVHDHIHLLSNALSVTFGLNPPGRDEKIHAMIRENDGIFQKFPSFVSAKIEDYTRSEIGVGGPYDLCAAGRYWCHDAKYRSACRDVAALLSQLNRVADAAAREDYYMGERYDMNYIYYNTGEDATRDWHGSPLYYEYPNVFIDVLVHDFLGIELDETCDLYLRPCCTDGTEVSMESFGIAYDLSGEAFTLTNLSQEAKDIRIDLSAVFEDWANNEENGEVFPLRPGETVRLTGKVKKV